jgi:hypothetical protein
MQMSEQLFSCGIPAIQLFRSWGKMAGGNGEGNLKCEQFKIANRLQ